MTSILRVGGGGGGYDKNEMLSDVGGVGLFSPYFTSIRPIFIFLIKEN